MKYIERKAKESKEEKSKGKERKKEIEKDKL